MPPLLSGPIPLTAVADPEPPKSGAPPLGPIRNSEVRDGQLARISRPLWILAGVGLLLRLLIVLWVPTQPVSDFWSYLARARNLVVEGTYGPFPGRPDASYPPAYPLLLTLAVAGPGDDLLAAKLINVLLGTAAVLLAGRAGERLFGRRAGIFAAALVALAPRNLVQTLLLASENLFQPLLFAFVALLAGAWRAGQSDSGRVLAAGAVSGALALTRAVGYGLWILWPLSELLAGRGWIRALRTTAAVLAIHHLVLLPWALRNQQTLGRFTFQTSVRGINLFLGNSEGATGEWYEWLPSLRALRPEVESLGGFARDAIAEDEARKWIREHPLRAVRLYFARLWRTLTADESFLVSYSVTGRGAAPPRRDTPVLAGPHVLLSHASGLLLGMNLAHWALSGLAALGLIVARGDRKAAAGGAWRPGLLVTGLAAYFPAVSALFLASSRFRWPAMDMALLLAALALAWLARYLRPAEGTPAAAARRSDAGRGERS